MTNEVFTMWFQDGGGRTTIYGRLELRKYAKQYAFNADEVINKGETEMLCYVHGDVVGGVFKEKLPQ
tara:strand:+ start:889 stop:1089 length:201 start_codon:yes stop_codon:yes gene_type:complete